METKEKTEHKLDEDGHIIIAENVPIMFTANIITENDTEAKDE